MTASTEKNSKQTDKPDLYQDAPFVQQQRGHSPVKHTDNPRKKAEQDSTPRVKPTGWTCGECLQWFPEREPYVAHMKTNHRRSVKRYPCRHCEQSFKSASSLRRHIRTGHDGKKKTYTCWYCTDTRTIYATSVMLKNHISLMHGIKNPDLGLMPKTHIQESKKSFGKGLISKRPAMGTQEEGQDHTNSLDTRSAKRLKSQFRCSKCGFITEDSTQFQQHISQHKSDENTPQCLHCGLCFTSVLSLNRHLFIVHKVKDSEGEEAGEKEKDEEESAVEVREKEQDNQPVKSAETEVNDSVVELKETEPLQAEEAASLLCDQMLDCNVNLGTQTQAASLR